MLWLRLAAVASGLSGAAPDVYRYFAQRDGSTAAAGIVGNTQQESANNPGAQGGGLIQGQGGRTSSGSLQQQLAGVQRELEGPERGTLKALEAAKGPREAARIFSERFERPGIPMLGNRERYAGEALARFGRAAVGRLGGGGGEVSSPAVSGASAESPAQLEDVLALVDALKSSGSGTSVQGISLPQPTAEAVSVPHAPRELPQPSSVAPSSLLALLAKIGEDGSTEPASSGAVPVAPSAGGASSGAYVNPLPGFTKGRTDQGVDYSAKPGTPIRAIGNGKVLGISPDWFKGQPYVYYQLTDGPQRGKVIYVAEQIAPQVKAGETVRAGQTIGTYAPSGTGIETGYGTTTGGVVATPYNGAADGTETSGGKAARAFLEHLGAR